MRTLARCRCSRQHRTDRAFATCAWPAAVWISGTGRYALLAHCDVLSVSLHATLASARADKHVIDTTACGHACRGHHEIVLLRLAPDAPPAAPSPQL